MGTKFDQEGTLHYPFEEGRKHIGPLAFPSGEIFDVAGPFPTTMIPAGQGILLFAIEDEFGLIRVIATHHVPDMRGYMDNSTARLGNIDDYLEAENGTIRFERKMKGEVLLIYQIRLNYTRSIQITFSHSEPQPVLTLHPKS